MRQAGGVDDDVGAFAQRSQTRAGRPRSLRAASRSIEKGWRRRVSLKRRTSNSSAASRKSSRASCDCAAIGVDRVLADRRARAPLRRSSAMATSRTLGTLQRGNRACRARREAGVRCSRSPNLRKTLSLDSSPHRRDPSRRRSAANSYEALFARTRQRPHSEARAAHRGALADAGATSRSSCSSPIRRCTTRAAARGPGRVAPARRCRRRAFGELKHEIGRLIYRIESLGCIVKDIDLGLVDFPAMRDDEPIYLCWKLGEAGVAYWHGIDEGFSIPKAASSSESASWLRLRRR